MNRWRILFIAGLFLIIDQISKWWSIKNYWAIINPGISFNFYGDQGRWIWLVIVSAILFVFFLFKFWSQQQLGLIMILVGAISNLLDRIIWSGVVDWLPIPFLNLKNNFADWIIFSGAMWIIGSELCKSPLFTKTKTS